MKRLVIDFAPRSLERTVLTTPLATWLLLLAAVAAWIGVAIKAADYYHRREAASAVLRQVLKQTGEQLQEREARKLAASKFTIPESQLNAVNGAVAQLNLPWRDMFDALEAATPASIALLSIEPDAKKHLLRATAEAKNSDDMIGYVEELKKQSFFSSVLLTRHEINEQDPNKPIRFQFEAEWREAAQ
jgi:Tfp pilus assembly protein PilN